MTPIKVLLLFSVGELGGAERSLTRMTLANDDATVSYDLATIGADGDWSAWVRSRGIEPLVWNCEGAGAALRGIPALVRYVRRACPDVIYAVGLRACTVVRAAKPWLKGTRIVHGIRTSFPPGAVLTRRYRRVERMFRSLTDGYIANSHAGAASLAAIAAIERARIRVIPNGVDVPPPGPPFAVRPKAVVVIANLNPLKGHLPFLDVVAAVARAHPDVLFYFVGRDDMQGAVQAQAAARGLSKVVRFEGFQHDVSRFWAAGRLFVLPSQITEGTPTAILEAQAAGLPAVAFDVGGVNETIVDGVDGQVVPRGDAAAMTRAICDLLENPEVAERMGLAGRSKIEAGFSAAVCAQRHAQAWRELAPRAPIGGS